MQPNFGVERTSEEGATGAGGQMADVRGRKAIVSGQVSILGLEVDRIVRGGVIVVIRVHELPPAEFGKLGEKDERCDLV